jgi:hypothetical protein
VGPKFVPVTVSVGGGPPATAELGIKSEMVGPLIKQFTGVDAPPPGPGLETDIWATPPVTMSVAAMVANKLVLEIKVVG